MPNIGLALGAPVMSYNNGESTTIIDGFEEALENESDNFLEDWIIDKVVDDKEEPTVKEVIKIEQIYVTKDEVDSEDFILGVLLVTSIIIAVIVIVLLCVCIFRTFSSSRESHQVPTTGKPTIPAWP